MANSYSYNFIAFFLKEEADLHIGNFTMWVVIECQHKRLCFFNNKTCFFFSFFQHPLPVSHHRFPVQSHWGWSIGHLPSTCGRQLRPSLLFHGVPWEPHGVPGPGDIKRRGGPNLDNRPPLSDGRHQWWRLAGQTAAHTRPISFCEAQCHLCVHHLVFVFLVARKPKKYQSKVLP